MTDTADVIVIGAGVQGASLAFHLAAARRAGSSTVERAVAGAGATGRSSGLVRMYYDLLAEAKLAWESFQWFREWDERVGGECGFTKTGFLWIEPLALADRVRAEQRRAPGDRRGLVVPRRRTRSATGRRRSSSATRWPPTSRSPATPTRP